MKLDPGTRLAQLRFPFMSDAIVVQGLGKRYGEAVAVEEHMRAVRTLADVVPDVSVTSFGMS